MVEDSDVEVLAGLGIGVRACGGCGERLDDVEWLSDPCVEGGGAHREAHGFRWQAARVFRVAGALWGFAKARCPKWLLPVLAVCLVIPGPVDELLVLGVVLFPVLRSRSARRELGSAVVAAWRG